MNKWKERYPHSEQVYKALPFVYLGAGLLTMLLLRNLMAVFSGLILVAAACIVWGLRYQYRRAFNRSHGVIELQISPDQARPVDALVQISWRAEFECGHPVIDAQHRRLFGISNELINAVKKGLSKSTLEALLDDLIDHFNEHIESEEAILARLAHPVSAEHHEHHHALLATAAALRQRFHESDLSAVELSAFLAYDVVSKHVMTEDLKYALTAA